MAISNMFGALSTKKKIFLVVAAINVLFLALYQGLFSKFYNSMGVEFVHSSVRQNIRTFVIREGEQNVIPSVDIHLEDAVFGHTGEVTSGHAHQEVSEEERARTIAIGGGITSKGVKGVTKSNVASKFQLFFTLLPSFCKTASKQFHYHFYLAYDKNDAFFNNIDNMIAFQAAFRDTCAHKCASSMNTSLHLVQCEHNGRPAWAQNDAMLEAYIDNVEYFYRVNDDSDLSTAGWTEAFISTLGKYKPANVGVVGPKHRGGNEAILTYDFVHRTHVEIFGFYYPRAFPDWWADDWVTKVYQPGRSTKMASIKLTHTMKLGQRYKLQSSRNGAKLKGQLEDDKKTINRYIAYAKEKAGDDYPKPDGSKVISMSLYGSNTLYTYGAIRNAQLLPVVYPGWNLRLYVPGPNSDPSLVVPTRILGKLRFLGVQIATVNATTQIPPQFWRYFIADDKGVDAFMVRDADARISDREFAAVQAWEESGASFHTIRDHPKHAETPVVEGLWGAKTEDLSKLLRFTMHDVLHKNLTGLEKVLNTSVSEDLNVLNHVIWPLVQTHTVSHDSVSCKKWPLARPFPVERPNSKTYIGQRYDARMIPSTGDTDKLKSVSASCTGKFTGKVTFSPISDGSNVSDVSKNLQLIQVPKKATTRSDKSLKASTTVGTTNKEARGKTDYKEAAQNNTEVKDSTHTIEANATKSKKYSDKDRVITYP